MPNWTSCKIDAYSNDADAVKSFLDAVKSEESDFDFNRIIPMPEVLKNTGSGSTIIDGQRYDTWKYDVVDDKEVPRLPTLEEIAEFDRIGYNNWYDWSHANWGVKWNATDIGIDNCGTYAEITFDTPWSEPEPIFVKLREMFPLVEFSFYWRYEDESIYPHSM